MDATPPIVVDTDVISYLFKSHPLATAYQTILAGSNVHSADIMSLYPSDLRLFRVGAYPPLRGTYLTLGEESAILYTKGSVNFFETFPGMYVSQTLGIRFDDVEEGPLALGAEILALTKMNWNNTQFDGYSPITLVASRKVGQILKYVPEDGKGMQSRYSFYM